MDTHVQDIFNRIENIFFKQRSNNKVYQQFPILYGLSSSPEELAIQYYVIQKQSEQPTIESTHPRYEPIRAIQPRYEPIRATQPRYEPTRSTQPMYEPIRATQPRYEPTRSTQPMYEPTRSTQPRYEPTRSTQPIYEPTEPEQSNLRTEITSNDENCYSIYSEIKTEPHENVKPTFVRSISNIETPHDLLNRINDVVNNETLQNIKDKLVFQAIKKKWHNESF